MRAQGLLAEMAWFPGGGEVLDDRMTRVDLELDARRVVGRRPRSSSPHQARMCVT